MIRKTPLYDEHIGLQAKMIEYAGYYMPVEYEGIGKEHMQVRQRAGLFDVSHMGKILVKGPKAHDFVNYLFTNRLSNVPFTATYGLLLDDNGLIIDDLIAYPLSKEEVLLVVNAVNAEKDYAHIAGLASKYTYEVSVKEVTGQYAQIALQGPASNDLLEKVLKIETRDLRFFRFAVMSYEGEPLIVSRSGYTGEDGFELYADPSVIKSIWKELLRHPAVRPVGLGARDTLRFEASLSLYGHEISEARNPLEAGLSFAVDFTKPFVGSEALKTIKEQGASRRLVGLRLLQKSIARSGYEVYDETDRQIGYVTSGYLLPGHDDPIALAYIDKPFDTVKTKCFVKVRQNKIPAEIIPPVFMQKKYYK